jgi:transposase
MGREYVGIDFHRRRSVIVRLSEAGERLSAERVVNDRALIAAAVSAAGPSLEVVIEATYGWYWVVDLLQELGAVVHLANPNALNWGERRVKNDVVDATDLADMLRMGRLPEAWIAPSALRELRELVRYRVKLVQLRTGLKAQVHAVMAKQGVLPGVVNMFGPAGQVQLDEIGLDRPYRMRVESLRELIAIYDGEVGSLEREIHDHLRHHPGYLAVQAINGVGRTIAAILVVEIGDITRFPTPRHLCSWAGLTPGRRESDRKGHDTDITKHGSRLLRWAVVEGISPLPRRRLLRRRVPPHRRTPRQEHGPGGDRPPGPHLGLLRPARRRDPPPQRATGGGMRFGPDHDGELEERHDQHHRCCASTM